MGFLDSLFVKVEMPGRARRDLVEAGIRCVRTVVEAEARASRERSGDAFGSCVMFKTAGGLRNGEVPVFTEKKSHSARTPPDLHSAVLSFPARLLTLVRDKCDGRGVIAYKRSGVKRNVYSRLVSSEYATADKRTVLQFCIGLQLNRTEADLLLKSAGYAFSGTIPLDCAFAYCIDNQIWNLDDINEILNANGLMPINDGVG